MQDILEDQVLCDQPAYLNTVGSDLMSKVALKPNLSQVSNPILGRSSSHNLLAANNNVGKPVNLRQASSNYSLGEMRPAYAGMDAVMVRHYSKQPLYKGIRYGILAILILTMILLSAMSTMTIMKTAPSLEKWKVGPIYQIIPEKFHDSDNDNLGDLHGIIQKLDYLKSLGIGTIYLNSFYQSPRKVHNQFGSNHDISDYLQVGEKFGTLQDFQTLIDTCKLKDIKVILDFIPNHTSDEHEWFKISSNPEHELFDKFKDFYIWRPANNQSICPNDLPNNWVNQIQGPIFTWSESRNMYYLHQFDSHQPDLNLNNEQVVQELLKVMDFWLQKGIDGFVINNVEYFFEASHFRNEQGTASATEKYCSSANSQPTDVFHDFTKNQAGIHPLLQIFRAKLLEFSSEPGVDKILITDFQNVDGFNKIFGNSMNFEAHMNQNFLMSQAEIGVLGNASQFYHQVIKKWLSLPTENTVSNLRNWPSWSLGNQLTPRIAAKTNPKLASLLAAVSLTLPGLHTIFYGDENAMLDSETNSHIHKLNFNFSETSPTFQMYQKLIHLNKNYLQIHRGHFCPFDEFDQTILEDKNVLMYTREQLGLDTGFLIILNFNDFPVKFDLSSQHFETLRLDSNCESVLKSSSHFSSHTEKDNFLPYSNHPNSSRISCPEQDFGDYQVSLDNFGFIIVEYEIRNFDFHHHSHNHLFYWFENSENTGECFVFNPVRIKNSFESYVVEDLGAGTEL